MQASAAAKQQRPLCRGTHAKGVCARAAFEVFDVTVGREPALATRLAKGIFAKPGVYPAVVRFANADASINSDFKPDVRSLSFSVDLARDGIAAPEAKPLRQDFSMQNATTLPINDSPAFLATISLLTASNPIHSLWSLRFRDKLRVMRTLALAEIQARQTIKPYQQLRYWSTVPFRHGPTDVVKFSAAPLTDNPARPLQRSNPAPQGRWQVERVRLCSSVSRHWNDEILGQASRRQFLDRKRERGVERIRSALPHCREIDPLAQLAALIRSE